MRIAKKFLTGSLRARSRGFMNLFFFVKRGTMGDAHEMTLFKRYYDDIIMITQENNQHAYQFHGNIIFTLETTHVNRNLAFSDLIKNLLILA